MIPILKVPPNPERFRGRVDFLLQSSPDQVVVNSVDLGAEVCVCCYANIQVSRILE